MSELWHLDYIQLAFRIDKIFHDRIGLPYVDFYYGPLEWKTQIGNEPEKEPIALLHTATALLDALTEQGFDQHRTTYLSKQVEAMETVCRSLNGERLSFTEELRGLFDISFEWMPEERFDEALAIYENVLPGKGTIEKRLHTWRKQHSISEEKRSIVPRLVERTLAEIHRRTLRFIDLPANESIDMQVELAMDGALEVHLSCIGHRAGRSQCVGDTESDGFDRGYLGERYLHDARRADGGRYTRIRCSIHSAASP